MTQSFGNVWDALADTREEAENLKMRSDMLMHLQKHLDATGYTQAQAAEQLGITQPRVSDIKRGNINRFSLDALVNLSARAGLHPRIVYDDVLPA